MGTVHSNPIHILPDNPTVHFPNIPLHPYPIPLPYFPAPPISNPNPFQIPIHNPTINPQQHPTTNP